MAGVTYAPGTGGTAAPTGGVSPRLGPEITTSDSTTGKKKAKKPKVGARKYKWPNGTLHSRPFHGHGGGGSGGSGGGGGGGSQPPAPSAHPLLDRANALANIRYGGAEQSLAQQGQAIAPWYQNYMNDVTAARTSSAQYAAPIQQAAQGRANEAGQVAAGIDPNTPAGHDAALAAAARQALGEGLVTALQGASQVNDTYLAGRQAVAATSELGSQQQVAKDKTALAKEKGAYVTSTVGDLKDKQRQQKLENQAFGIKAATAANSAASSAAQLNKYGYTDAEWAKLSDGERNKIRNKTAAGSGSHPDLGKVNKYGYTDKQWRGFSVGKRQSIMKQFDKSNGSGPNEFTPAARHKTKKDVRIGIAAVRSQIGVPGYNEKDFWSRARKGLVSEKGYDPLLAHAIIQRMRYGHVNAKVAKQLKKNYGITLGAGKAVKLPLSPSDVPVVGGLIGTVL